MSVNLSNIYGHTPLHFFAELGDLEATNFFVERGDAINSTNKYVNSPLSLAECFGELEIFHCLIEISVHSNICDY